jgi:capsular exopolysaccharide synthesis family protein
MTMSGDQSLLLDGGMPECGTTTVATNIALASAAAGKRVVVVDGNFRRPQLPDAFGITAKGPGLADLVNKSTTVDKTIVHIEENIDLIPAGNVASGVFERLNNAQFSGAIMAELRTRYDLIIIDTPPTVVAGDAVALASKVVDAAVIVVRANQDQRGLVARMINQFADTHCDLLGILLNRARGTVGGYFRKNFETMAEYAQSE